MSSTPFQASLAQGHTHFAAGRFVEAHEAWEHGWRATRGTEKQLLQVLVLWATAFHHRGNDNRDGALRVMARALERLSVPPIAQAPFDTEALRDALVESWERLSATEPATPAPWTPAPAEVEPNVELTERTLCPYCAAPVAFEIEPELAGGTQYIEDCPVCCRPWTVSLRREDGTISLQRSDD